MRGEDTMLKLGMKMGDIIELTEAVKGMSPPSPSQAEGPSSVSCLSQKYSKPQSSSRTGK